jgi:endonuclease/exonuclease/phosphatase (EEP) superfamily protein YafD
MKNTAASQSIAFKCLNLFQVTRLRGQGSVAAFIVTLAMATTVFAAPNCAEALTAPSLGISFGASDRPTSFDQSHLRLIVWNVHKGEDEALPQDLKYISLGSDLVLLQEAVSGEKFRDELSAANKTMGWTQAKAWERRDGDFTGVATGSRVAPLSEKVLLSNVTEPVLGTPKSMIVSEYAIKDHAESLLVVNIHAINFVLNDSFRAHMRQLVEQIHQHKGPMIVAGDFNTWNSARMDFLQGAFLREGMNLVNTPESGFLHLDHVYVRGLRADHTLDLSFIKSSDHAPLLVDFVIP